MFSARHHRIVGLVALAAFIGTGVYLRFGFPGGHESEVVRYLYRANHVYIALAGAANIGIGLGLVSAGSAGRRRVQAIASALMLGAPLVLLAAFFYDPPRAGPDRLVTTLGVVLVVAGAGLHLAAAPRPIR